MTAGELRAPEPIPELAPLDEVAARFGVPSRVLVELARAGRFPALIRATRRRAWVRRDDLERWIADHRDDPAALASRRARLDEAALPALRAAESPETRTTRRLPIRRTTR